MWPHHLKVLIANTVISIASDDPAPIERLEPWRIGEADELIDYALRLSPEDPEESKQRTIPNIRRGSDNIAQSFDLERLEGWLWRLLGGFERPASAGQVRLRSVAAMRDGTAILVPASLTYGVSHRRLDRLGIELLPVRSTLVDVASTSALLDPSLGSPEDPVSVPIVGWLLPSYSEDGVIDRATQVAHAMQMVDDLRPDNAQHTLDAVADLTLALPAELVSFDQNELVNRLNSSL